MSLAIRTHYLKNHPYYNHLEKLWTFKTTKTKFKMLDAKCEKSID